MLRGGIVSSSTISILPDQNEGYPLQVEADFPGRTISQIANQHRRFVAALSEQNYEVELLDDPA